MLSALAYLTSWGNAPFSIAIGVAALFSLLQVTGVLGLIAGGAGESDHDVDGGGDGAGDGGGEGGGETDADHDVDADHDADADGDHDADGESRGLAATALEPLGLGKIPYGLPLTFSCAYLEMIMKGNVKLAVSPPSLSSHHRTITP